LNYLGHLVLSPPDPVIRVANMATDWMDISATDTFPMRIQEGMRLHRAIDAFTDQHPAVREMNALIRPILRKYSPVGSDLIIDFLLAHHWYRFHNCSYSAFCSDMYSQLLACSSAFSPLIAERIQKMVEYRWLHTQRNSTSWTRTLVNMDKRAKFPSNFIALQYELLNHFGQYRTLFEELYVDAMHAFPSEYHL